MRRAILFGSLTSGIPTPQSDADILVIVASSEYSEMRDRIPALLAAMSPLPCSIDLFVLTVEEFERAQRDDDPLVREAVSHGVDLLNEQ